MSKAFVLAVMATAVATPRLAHAGEAALSGELALGPMLLPEGSADADAIRAHVGAPGGPLAEVASN